MDIIVSQPKLIRSYGMDQWSVTVQQGQVVHRIIRWSAAGAASDAIRFAQGLLRNS